MPPSLCAKGDMGGSAALQSEHACNHRNGPTNLRPRRKNTETIISSLKGLHGHVLNIFIMQKLQCLSLCLQLSMIKTSLSLGFFQTSKTLSFSIFSPRLAPCLIEILLSKPEEQQKLQVPGLQLSAHPTCACWMNQEEPAELRKAVCQLLVLGIFLSCFFQLQEKWQGAWKSGWEKEELA